jgi:hypothetical protein
MKRSPSRPSIFVPYLLSALLLLAAAITRAQTTTAGAHAKSGAASSPAASAPAAPNPTFLNQVYYYWSDSLLPCPKTDGRMASKINALGFGGAHSGYTLDGDRSALRIRASDTLRFAFRSASNGMMDPSMMFQLYKFDSKKGSRQASLGGQSRFGGNNNSKNQIAFDVQKSGTDVFILIPSARLAAGEYGFMNRMQMSGGGLAGMNMSYPFYTFGIDP